MSTHTFPLEDQDSDCSGPVVRNIPTPTDCLIVKVIFTRTHPVDGHYAFVEFGTESAEGDYQPLAVITADVASQCLVLLKRAITEAEALDQEP